MMKKVENPSTPKRDLDKPRKMGTKTVEGVVVGRDKTVIPPEEIFKLAAIGCKDKEVAEWFGIDTNTLRYNFSIELLKGRESLKHSLRRAQIKTALSGNPTLLIWLGKQYLGQTDSPMDASSTQILPWVTDNEENYEQQPVE
jgi:hypothetical protein